MGFFFFTWAQTWWLSMSATGTKLPRKKKWKKTSRNRTCKPFGKSVTRFILWFYFYFLFFLVVFLCLSCQPNDLALFQLMSLYLSISLSLYLSILRFSVEFPFQLFFFLFVLLFFFSWIWSFFVNPQSVKRCHRVHLCECVGLFCVNVWVSFVNLIRPLLSVLLGLFCQSY